MTERLRCEFFLIRHVPDVVKGEFVNIGVILREAESRAAEPPRTTARFTRNWSRIRCLDVDADVELLETLEADLIEQLTLTASTQNPKQILDVLNDSFSNAIQITEPRGCLAESLALNWNN